MSPACVTRPHPAAAHAFAAAIGHVRGDHGGAHSGVPEQFLARSDVVAGFQQVRGETVTKNVAGGGFGQAGALGLLAPKASGSATPPRLLARSCRCCWRTSAKCLRSGSRVEIGNTVTRSLRPLPSRIVIQTYDQSQRQASRAAIARDCENSARARARPASPRARRRSGSDSNAPMA